MDVCFEPKATYFRSSTSQVLCTEASAIVRTPKNIYVGAFKRELLKAFSSLFSQKSSFIDTFEVPKYAYEKAYSEIT